MIEDAARQIKAMAGDAPVRFKCIKKGSIHEFEGTLAQECDRLTQLCEDGYNVYVFAQDVPSEVGSRHAKDSDIKEVTVLFADGDESALPSVWHIEPSFTLIHPETKRWWAFWNVEGCPTDEFKEIQQKIATLYKSDPSVSNLGRVVRLAGFSRWKDGKRYGAYEFQNGTAEISAFSNHKKTLSSVAIERERPKADDPQQINVKQDLKHNIEAYVRWLEVEAKPAIEGQQGNNTLAATAAMGRSYALTPETTLAMIADFYNPRCEPEWDAEELERTVLSGYKSASSAQGNKTPEYRKARIEARAQAIQGLFRDRTAPEEGEGGLFRFWTIEELRAEPEPVWMIDEVIPEAGFTILYGPPGSFKSFLAMDMALSIAHGLPWRKRKTLQGRVLYMAGEGRRSSRKRIDAWLHEHSLPQTPDLLVVEPAPMLALPGERDAFLDEALRKGPFDLVIIDTIGRTMAGINDNATEGARLFSKFVESVRNTFEGAATLAISHAPKERPDVLLGSGAYEADADVIFNAVPTEKGKHINLRMHKTREEELWQKKLGFAARKVLKSLVLDLCEPVQDQDDRKRDKSETYEAQFRLALANRTRSTGKAMHNFPDILADMVMMNVEGEDKAGQMILAKSIRNWFQAWNGRHALVIEGSKGPNNCVIVRGEIS